MKNLVAYLFFGLASFFFFGSYLTIRDQGSSWTAGDLFVLAVFIFAGLIFLFIGVTFWSKKRESIGHR